MIIEATEKSPENAVIRNRAFRVINIVDTDPMGACAAAREIFVAVKAN